MFHPTAAATKLFHSSQSDDDDQEMEESSDESDEEEEDKKPMIDLFTKNKKRVAHTPNNQTIKPKKGSQNYIMN